MDLVKDVGYLVVLLDLVDVAQVDCGYLQFLLGVTLNVLSEIVLVMFGSSLASGLVVDVEST